ncbi:MAG: AraC family transcriptional regulator [Pseudomonadota bacterium]
MPNISSTLQVFAKDHIPNGQSYALARAALSRKRPKALHTQDYGEVFWVQNGRAAIHGPDTKRTLEEGSLALVAPGAPHAFQALDPETYVSVVLVPKRALTAIEKKHPSLKGTGFWTQAGLPIVVSRTLAERAELSKALRQLERGAPTDLKRDAFLLSLLASLPTQLEQDAPPWLKLAMSEAERPEVFRDGAAGLVAVAGKTPAHVSRSCQKFLGKSPSQLMNARRMAYAAQLLAYTDETLQDIADACGLTNLSHFHRLFQGHHQASPAAWRRAHQRNVISPE